MKTKLQEVLQEIYKNNFEHPNVDEENQLLILNFAREMCELQKISCVKAARTTWDFGHTSIESARVDLESIFNAKNVCDE